MRLLIIVASQERGGAEEYALRLASAAMVSWEVHVALPFHKRTESLERDFKATGAHVHRLRISERYFLQLQGDSGPDWTLSAPASTVVRFLRALERHYQSMTDIGNAFLHFLLTIHLLRGKYDAVLLNLPYPTYGFGIILACGFLKVPTTVLFHLYPFPVRFRPTKVSMFNWARSRNQQWVTVCEDNKMYLCGTFDARPVDILRIYNGIDFTRVDIEEGATAALRNQVRRDLGIPARAKILLTVGRLAPQKGYDDLLPTIPHILTEFPDVWFVWLGSGERQDYCERRLKEDGVSQRVLLLGHRSDVARFMRTADLLVMPSRFEGFPFVILEAMARGLPIVSTGAGGIPEAVQTRVHGLITRTGDSCDLLEGIRWALRHPQRMRAMARNAKTRVREFSTARMVRESLAVIRAVGRPEDGQSGS